MNHLHSQRLTVGYDENIVIDELSVDLPTGKMTAIVGANGSGKSTLLKTFARILSPVAGCAYLDAKVIHATPTRELARRMSILSQNANAPEALTVYELTSFGRYPYRQWLRGANHDDATMIEWALDVVGLADLQDRPVASLSGGQQQRAWIAMTLAQGAPYMLLDEPTNHLDTCHRLEVMELLARLNRQEGKTVVMVLHDLNLAARYADHMLAVKGGRVVAAGTPAHVMTESHLHEVFGISARILSDPQTGTPLCVAYLPEQPLGQRSTVSRTGCSEVLCE
jgi:iron complex transport system ATP-binding protein